MENNFTREEADYWVITGLLHDIDFELYPEEHCQRAYCLIILRLFSENGLHSNLLRL